MMDEVLRREVYKYATKAYQLRLEMRKIEEKWNTLRDEELKPLKEEVEKLSALISLTAGHMY